MAVVILLTRYSVKNDSLVASIREDLSETMRPNWQQLADNVNYNKAAGGLREQDRIDWLVARSEYFKNCSLRSVLRQERRPDFWFLLFSSGDEWAAAHVLPEDEHWIKPIFLAPGQSRRYAIPNSACRSRGRYWFGETGIISRRLLPGLCHKNSEQ